MAQTYGVKAPDVSIPRVNPRGVGPVNTSDLLRMYALVGQERDRAFQEKKFVTESLYQAHNLFKDIKVLPKDADVLQKHLGEVDSMIQNGITNVDQAMELQGKLMTALQNPEMIQAVLDQKRHEVLWESGKTYKEQLGRNALGYYDKLNELATTKGESDALYKIKISDFFDNTTQQLSDKSKAAETNLHNASAAHLNEDTKKLEYELGRTKEINKELDTLLEDPTLTDYDRVALKQGWEKKPWVLIAARKMAAEDAQKEQDDPNHKARPFEDWYRALGGEDRYYGQVGTGSTFNFGNKNDPFGGLNDSAITVPGVKDSNSQYDTESIFPFKKAPGGAAAIDPRVEETQTSKRAGRVFFVEGDKAVDIDPRQHNNPKDLSVARNSNELGTEDSEASDMANWWPGIGNWTNAVGLPNGNPLSTDSNSIDSFWNSTRVSRGEDGKSLQIQYPGKTAQDIYWELGNKHNPVINGTVRQDLTFADAKTNSIQIVQDFIRRGRKSGLTDDELRKRVSMDYVNDVPEFTIKNVLWTPYTLGSTVDSKQFDDAKRAYKLASGSQSVSTVGPQAGNEILANNFAQNTQNKELTQKVVSLGFQREPTAQILALQPSLLSKVMGIAETNPEIVRSAISDSAETRVYKSDHNSGNALDLTAHNIENSVSLISLMDQNYPGSIRTILFEAPDMATAKKLISASFGVTNGNGRKLFEKLKQNGVSIRPRINAAVKPHIHLSFEPTPTKNLQQGAVDEFDDINKATSEIDIPR